MITIDAVENRAQFRAKERAMRERLDAFVERHGRVFIGVQVGNFPSTHDVGGESLPYPVVLSWTRRGWLRELRRVPRIGNRQPWRKWEVVG